MCFRITLNGMKVSRPDVRIGRYRMIKHERDKHNEPNPQRYCVSVSGSAFRSICVALVSQLHRCFWPPLLSPLERALIMQHCKGCTINHMSLLLVIGTEKYGGTYTAEDQHSHMNWFSSHFTQALILCLHSHVSLCVITG